MNQDVFGPTGKPTKEMVFELANNNGILFQWLTLWQAGVVTFEEALMGSVITLTNMNSTLEDRIKQMLSHYYPPVFIPVKNPLDKPEEK